MQFQIVTKGELTKKQEQRLETMKKIAAAFFNEKHEKVPRTWSELQDLTELSKGTLSKYTRELSRQGVIKTERRINNRSRFQTFYELTNATFQIKGKKDLALKPAYRIYHTKKHVVAVESGYTKRTRSGKRYFVRNTEPGVRT
jgi:DNA-binding transcriptional ArsR family regulator